MPSSSTPTTRRSRTARAWFSRSSLRTALRETITLRPLSLTSMTLKKYFWPTKFSSSWTKPMSICEAGQKARTPPISTSRPAFTALLTVPSTGTPLCWASSSTWVSTPPLPSCTTSRMPSRPAEATVARTRSPTLTLRLPSLSLSWSRSMRASALAPMSINTLSLPISATMPSTICPVRTRRAPVFAVPAVASNICAKSSSCWAAMGGQAWQNAHAQTRPVMAS